jgi:hypothetical protein
MSGKNKSTRKRATTMKIGVVGEREHDFTLVLTGVAELTPEREDALFEAGCDDATISIRSGRVYLTFSRHAPSLTDAILSAIRDVRNAGIGADVLRVDAVDLVTQSDIARRIDRTRQLVHQYIAGTRGPGGFPAPVCKITEGIPMWSWGEVASWLRQHDMIRPEVASEARGVALINIVLELRRYQQLEPELSQEILQDLVG